MMSKVINVEQKLADIRADSEIVLFYARKNVFVTGGTGFMGKVLIHKLLESVAEIGKVFVLIRAKNGKTPQKRLEDMMDKDPFRELTKSKPHIKEKLVAVEGDVTSDRLGMSVEDYQRVVNEVSVMYHVAATVKFEEDLTKSVEMNVKGTAAVVELALQIGVPKLAAFMHISTAYTHCYSDQLIREAVYPSKRDPDEIIELCARGDTELIDSPEFTRRVIGDHPNTYTFTKEIAEKIVNSVADVLPVAIVRPSIVVAAIREPLPGWVDNLYGPTGMMIGANAGILRTMHVLRNKKADLLPVDMAINLLCAATWKTNKDFYAQWVPPVESGARGFSRMLMGSAADGAGVRRRCRKAKPGINSNNNVVANFLPEASDEADSSSYGSTCPVYNCVTGNSAPLTWGRIENMGNKMILKYPLEKMMWYPGGSFKSNRFVNELCSLFQHKLFAVIADLFLRLVGEKPVVRKTLAKAEKAMAALSFFATREWTWETENLNSLADELSESDRDIFSFDMRTFDDWPGYFEMYVQGCRRYLVKDDPNTLEACRRKLKWFYLLHLGFRFLLTGGMAFLVYHFFLC